MTKANPYSTPSVTPPLRTPANSNSAPLSGEQIRAAIDNGKEAIAAYVADPARLGEAELVHLAPAGTSAISRDSIARRLQWRLELCLSSIVRTKDIGEALAQWRLLDDAECGLGISPLADNGPGYDIARAGLQAFFSHLGLDPAAILAEKGRSK